MKDYIGAAIVTTILYLILAYAFHAGSAAHYILTMCVSMMLRYIDRKRDAR